MQKKIILIIIAVTFGVAAVAIAVFFFLTRMQESQKEFSVDSLLPRGAFSYIQINDVKKNINVIKESPLGKSLYNLDYDLLYAKNIINKNQMQLIEYIKNNLSDFTDSLVFEKFFSQEITFVMYKTNIGFNSVAKVRESKIPQLADLLSSGIFLVSKIPLDAQIAESFVGLFAKNFEDVSMSGEEYKGYTVRIIKFKEAGIKLSYIKIKNYLVIGLGDQAAKLSIDTYEGLQSSLSQDEQFQEVKSKALNPRSLFCYVDINYIFSNLKSQMIASMDVFNLSQEGQRKALDKIKESFIKITNFRYMNISIDIEKKAISKALLQFFYDRQNMASSVAEFYQCPSSVNKTAKFIPREALAYQWSNCVGFKNAWKNVKAERFKEGEDLAKNANNEKLIDLVEKGILSSLGNEIGGYLTGVKKGGIFPVPQLALFIEVSKRNVIEELLDKLKDSPLFFLRSEEYQGITLKYIVFPMKIVAEPSYCFIENYLVLAINRDVLKKAIDAYKDSSKSILSDQEYSQKEYGFNQKNRGTQFFRVNQLAKVFDQVVAWRKESYEKQVARQSAFLSGKKKHLEEKKQELLTNQESLKKAKEKAASLQDQVAKLESQQADSAEVQNQFNMIAQKRDDFAKAIEEDKDEIADMESLISDLEGKMKDSTNRQVFVDEVVEPLMSGVKSISTIGTKTNNANGLFEFLIFLK